MSRYTATPHPKMDDCVVVVRGDEETIVPKDWAEDKDWIDVEESET